MMAHHINIRLKSLLRTYDLCLSPSSTAADILLVCPEKTRRTILFLGKQLGANQLLQSAGVEEGSVLFLVTEAADLRRGLVLVRWDQRVLPVQCDEQMTVAGLKDFCMKKLQIRRDAARIIYHGSELHDSQVVSDCVSDARPDLVLEFPQRPKITEGFDVEVRTLTGKCYFITVNASLSVGDVREIISEHEGFPNEGVRLMCAGHCLSDEETVGQLRMTPTSVLYVILRLR